MNKKTFFLLISVVFVLASCGQQELQNVVGGDNNLSEEDVISITKDFVNKSSTRNANNITFSIEKK